MKYSTDNRIAQISLYRNEIVGQVGLPFILMPSSSDVFLMQAVSTWGECWTYSMWQGFREWLQYFDEKRIDFLDMPETYKRWTKAWSKYYNAYLLDTNKYVIYPYTSLTTNFNEAGEHASASNSIVQVVLQQSDMEYRMENYDLLVKYDIFRNNQNIYDWIKIPREDVLLDIYGYHEIKDGYKYLLTSKKYPFKAVKAYAAKLTPIELNLKYDITGSGVYLYELPDGKSVVKKPKYHKEFVASYLNKYNAHVLIDYMSEYIKRKVIARFK